MAPLTRRNRRIATILTPVGAVLAIGAFALWRATAAPDEPPALDGPAPRIAESGYVSVSHSELIDAPRPAVLSWANDPDLGLEDVVDFDGGFPAVESTEPLIGDWVPGEREGDRRRVRFADGHYLAEQVVVDTDARFQYMIWGFTSAQRFAIRHGLAEFTYEPVGDRTRLTWTYSFLPTTPALRPFVQNFLDTTMTPMMRATLAGMRDGAEAAHAAPKDA